VHACENILVFGISCLLETVECAPHIFIESNFFCFFSSVAFLLQSIGQPVLIGGSMGTASYILLGTEGAMKRSFGSTCHGAGRALSRSKAIKTIDSKSILAQLASKGIIVKVATRHLAAEESPAAYKDVDSVVATCELAGLSKKVARLVPLAVVKG
jgi:tRNA-splicing ligase RtcB (3'-phosphate/5'-hydroxy nucleic acid ligase)